MGKWLVLVFTHSLTEDFTIMRQDFIIQTGKCKFFNFIFLFTSAKKLFNATDFWFVFNWQFFSILTTHKLFLHPYTFSGIKWGLQKRGTDVYQLQTNRQTDKQSIMTQSAILYNKKWTKKLPVFFTNFNQLNSIKRNWFYVTNSDFLIPISLQSNFVSVRHFKL